MSETRTDTLAERTRSLLAQPGLGPEAVSVIEELLQSHEAYQEMAADTMVFAIKARLKQDETLQAVSRLSAQVDDFVLKYTTLRKRIDAVLALCPTVRRTALTKDEMRALQATGGIEALIDYVFNVVSRDTLFGVRQMLTREGEGE